MQTALSDSDKTMSDKIFVTLTNFALLSSKTCKLSWKFFFFFDIRHISSFHHFCPTLFCPIKYDIMETFNFYFSFKHEAEQ